MTATNAAEWRAMLAEQEAVSHAAWLAEKERERQEALLQRQQQGSN